MMEFRTKDMYGHPMMPIGETGYAVTVAFSRMPSKEPPGVSHPELAVFHASDGFRQALFCVDLDKGQLFIRFDERLAEVVALREAGGWPQ